MKIRRIKVENFKSYKKLDVELNNLNIIIGGNASGKSNYVNILKFFDNIIYYGLDDAILLQGGIKYLFNSNSRKSSNILLYLELDFEKEENDMFRVLDNEDRLYLPKILTYTLKIKPNEKGEGYRINSEKIEINFELLKKSKEKNILINSYKMIVDKDSNGKITNNFNDKLHQSDEYAVLNIIMRFMRKGDLLLTSFFSSFGYFYRYDGKIKIYNFDVDLLKSPSSIVGRSELEENGSNLVNIIQQLLKNRAKKEKLNKLIKIILPFIDDIKIENNVNKSVFFKVKESYNKKEFPSYMLSDGTVNILAVIIALYFQDNNDIIVLEEPEKNIHPKLLSTLVNILNDVSEKKQIFITTHNPYIVKEADLNDIFLVSRGNDGISKISKPINDNRIKEFLKNDLGIEDLFMDGILK